jgi:Asp-tRNA(Asn)/Glu-tRNA(Gln) amidotransferase A subunit family amidase
MTVQYSLGVRDLVGASIAELTTAVSAGRASALEVVEAHLARIGRVAPRLNAFVDVCSDEARTAARAQDDRAARGLPRGPLGGVPVSVKSAIEVAGLRCETGSPLRAGVRASTDAVVVQRLRAAGAIVIGTTNVAEMLMGYETVNPLHGRTRNPWDLARTPGGSSGGEAAAIAAGGSVGGLGSDGGGSVRVPAHWCGIAALKPTPGRVPGTGHQPPCLGPFSLLGVVGPMARTIADVEALYRVIAGWDAGDPLATWARHDSGPVAPANDVWWFETHRAAPTAFETRTAITRAVAALEVAGFTASRRQPAGIEAAGSLWDTLFGDAGELLLGGEPARHLPILEALHRERGPRAPLTAARLTEAWIARDDLRASFTRELGGRVLVCPVAAVPAPRHDERAWTVGAQRVGYLDAMVYTQWFNLLGATAAVVPVGRSPEGLPIGVQIVGAPFMEAHVLAAAGIVERACGGFAPPPEAVTA